MSENKVLKKNTDTIQAVDKALDIMEYLSDGGVEVSISKISSDLGLYKSTVHRVINSLCVRGYAYKNPDNQKYALSMKLHTMGSKVKENTPFYKIVSPYADAIELLAEKYDECVNISIIDLDTRDIPRHTIVFQISKTNNSLRLMPSSGSPNPSHCSASGKCLMAFSQNDFLEKFTSKALPRYTENTITDWRRMDDELKQVRSLGYAQDLEETEVGLTCIAVPIRKNDNPLVAAAISIAGATNRMKQNSLNEIVFDLKQLAVEISHSM